LAPFSTESFTSQPALVAAPETKAATSGVTFHWRSTLFTVPVGTESVGAATNLRLRSSEGGAVAPVHVTPNSVQLAATTVDL